MMPARMAKPVPVRGREIKSTGWKRERTIGFVCPRLNEPGINTQAFGFIDPRQYECADEEDRRR